MFRGGEKRCADLEACTKAVRPGERGRGERGRGERAWLSVSGREEAAGAGGPRSGAAQVRGGPGVLLEDPDFTPKAAAT